MAQIRDIKNRITSVKKTKKITQAMKMVAAAKFKRAADQVMKVKPYVAELEALMTALVQREEGQLDSKFFRSNPDATKNAVILISGDRGLCGGFNANTIKFATNFIQNSEKDLDIFTFGSKGHQHFKRHHDQVTSLYEGPLHEISKNDVDQLFSPVLDGFLAGDYGQIILISNEFVSALATNLDDKQLLPYKPQVQDNSTPVDLADYIYEPDQGELIDSLIKTYLTFTLYRGLVESRAGEEGARMAAMDAATDNASEMIKSLTLIYNRSRQAQITTELSEIVAGAEAQSQ